MAEARAPLDAGAGGLPRLDRRSALFLDFDGTLAEIAPSPDTVRVDPALPPLLDRLARALDGAVAIVTGRRLDDVDRMLAPLRLAGAGLHGAELRRAAAAPALPVRAEPGLAAARLLLSRFVAGRPGVLLEDKGRAIALHYRAAPEAGTACMEAAAEAARLAGADMELLHGKMVVELKPAGCDKGRAIAALLTAPPFLGRVPVFAGDDVTDEAGFRAVAAAGGSAIRVGLGPSAAAHAVAGVAALHAWLAAAAARLDPQDGGTRC